MSLLHGDPAGRGRPLEEIQSNAVGYVINSQKNSPSLGATIRKINCVAFL